MQHSSPSLSTMWALEDSDHMKLAGDFLELPEFTPTLIPTLRFDPEDVPSIKHTPKRRSLLSLKTEKAVSTRLKEQLSAANFSNKVEFERKRLRHEISCLRARMLIGHISSTKTYMERELPTLVQNGKCSLSLMTNNHEATCAQLAKMCCNVPPQETKTISSSFLSGAAALGLRHRHNRATSEPPVQPSACFNRSTFNPKHLTNTNVKERVHTDERFARARSEQMMKETMLVPHAPNKPQCSTHRKRPQIRGVPILIVPTN